MNPKELLAIFQRIVTGEQTTADVAALGDVLISTGNQHVVQSGSGNINIGQGRDIQILHFHFSEQQSEIIHRFLDKLNWGRQKIALRTYREVVSANLSDEIQH